MESCGYFSGGGHDTQDPYRPLASLANRNVDSELKVPAITVGTSFDDATSLAAGHGDERALWVLRGDTGTFDGVRATRLDPESGTWAPEVDVQNGFNPV